MRLENGGEIPFLPPVVAGQDEPRLGVEIFPVKIEGLDQVLELLVRDQPADEQDVRLAVVENASGDGIARPVELGEIHEDGQDARPGVAEGLELPAVELGIAHGQVHLVHEQLDLQSPLVALPRQDAVGVHKKRVRGDVVVDHDLFIGHAEKELRDRRPDRKMENDDVRRRADLLVFPVVPPLPGRPGVEEPGEDLRPVAALAQHSLDLEHLVRDGVAVAQRGRELVDVHQTAFSLSFSRRSKTARYFFSMTSQR